MEASLIVFAALLVCQVLSCLWVILVHVHLCFWAGSHVFVVIVDGPVQFLGYFDGFLL